MFVFLVVPILYPKGTLAGFAKATKTCPAAKWYWRPLNLKRSLPVLKWSSESEGSKNVFADIYIYIYNPVQEQSLDTFAVHARRGVMMANYDGNIDGVHQYMVCSNVLIASLPEQYTNRSYLIVGEHSKITLYAPP